MKIYSHRKRDIERGESYDVYKYDVFPQSLRVQIKFIWETAIGPYYRSHAYDMSSPDNNNAGWETIRSTICREKGKSSLSSYENPRDDCVAYLLNESNVDELLDLIEFSFRYISKNLKNITPYERKKLGITQISDEAIDELNYRFQEARVGYQFTNHIIVRIDSQLIHSEVVIPALELLSDRRFSGAQEEYLNAHEHYRSQEYRDANVDALNSLESTLKTICEINGWDFDKKSRANDLISIIRNKGLLPEFSDKSFDQLIATLKSSVPAIRNEAGGHGQGSTRVKVPHYISAYALHMTAATIILLCDAQHEYEKKTRP